MGRLIRNITDELIEHAESTLQGFEEKQKLWYDAYIAYLDEKDELQKDPLYINVTATKHSEKDANETMVQAQLNHTELVDILETQDYAFQIQKLFQIRTFVAKLKTGTHHPTTSPTQAPNSPPTPAPTTTSQAAALQPAPVLTPTQPPVTPTTS